MHACGNKRVEAEITSSGSHDEIRHIHRLFITVVGLDKTISIGLEFAVVANHPSQHIGSRVRLQAHRLDSLRRQLELEELAAQGVELMR